MPSAFKASFSLNEANAEKATPLVRPNETNPSQFAKRVVLDYIEGKLSYERGTLDADTDEQLKKAELELKKARKEKLDLEITILQKKVAGIIPVSTPNEKAKDLIVVDSTGTTLREKSNAKPYGDEETIKHNTCQCTDCGITGFFMDNVTFSFKFDPANPFSINHVLDNYTIHVKRKHGRDLTLAERETFRELATKFAHDKEVRGF